MESDIFRVQITVEKYFICSIYSTSEAGTTDFVPRPLQVSHADVMNPW